MDAAAEIGSNPESKHQIRPKYRDEQADENKFSGANGDKELFIFPVQLTTRRIGNLTRLILTFAICDNHTYILLSPLYQGLDWGVQMLNRQYLVAQC